MSSLEHHPYNSIAIPPETRTLIVGTAPPPRFSLPRPPHEGPKPGCDADFYYGSASNMMWVYLENAEGRKIFAEPGSPEASVEDTVKLMEELLTRHNLWMRDVLQSYRRKPGHEGDSSDSGIDIVGVDTTFMDFAEVLAAGPHIDRVVFTSVNSAKLFFTKAVTAVGQHSFEHVFATANALRKARKGIDTFTEPFYQGNVGGRTITFYIAPSPSPAAPVPDVETCTKIYRRIVLGQA
ncbi:hypothetical protein [Rhodopseudomonas sp. B29]|uniref:hypothetical protein n=1 Tax=Rhodopseudomonas sp. B29 TaxID=95607 RepID=UPI0011D1EE8E|nr:hypothetical protein [Rhodopseudomonas sp. B29]